ncbi:acetyltransferase [Xanthomonas sp. GW]|uniref:NeuD/PglB/VioB family sugar acetyltransferase n=1 Tax=Xanthomonas sp. GW TaxID=2724121 RepID=UPI00163A2D1F|nr:NeuD/PglB/VioB family sugar acetyltransferase [Xanthomonas sp. GW]QNH21404.1 acetyltransferase [Xanthomonas sp. GW]
MSTPVEMPREHVLIVGAGGFGRGIAAMAYHEDPSHGRVWDIKGFLDSRTELASGLRWPLLGDPDTYRPEPGDLFVCALGNPAARRRYSQPLLARGANFIVLRPQLREASPTPIGRGSLFEVGVGIGADCSIGEFVTILATTIVGHDVTIGDYVQIGNFVFIGGGVRIGNDVTIHPHATVLPGVAVGDGAVIGAGSVVIKDVPPNVTVAGNPARTIFSK